MGVTAVLTKGEKCNIHPDALVGLYEHGGEVILGDLVSIRFQTILRTCGGTIKIRDRTIINYRCIFHGKGGITIGSDTIVSPCVQIYAQNHGLEAGSRISGQPQSARGVVIGNDCWIGASAIILDGARIGSGCVIAAGAVVTRGDYETNGIYGGNPARLINRRPSP